MENLFTSHFKALMYKRFFYWIKDKVGIVCELFLPMIFILVGCLIINYQFVRTFDELELSTSFYGNPNKVFISSQAGVNN